MPNPSYESAGTPQAADGGTLVRSSRVDWPDVDVVIPTLNATRHLSRCLASISRQRYEGRIRVIVIDGGSEDHTTSIAQQAGAEVYRRPGMYCTGLHGARDFALELCTAEFYWQLDADNFVIGDRALERLVRPFTQDSRLAASVPFVSTSPEFSPICNWYALQELEKLTAVAESGVDCGEWFVVDDLTFGISNGTVLRTSVLRDIGGYDSDVRVLSRMRRKGTSRAALVPSARYLHLTAEGPWEVVQKTRSRFRRFGTMSQSELSRYFVNYPGDRGEYSGQATMSVISAPFRALSNLSRGGPRDWGWGIPYPLLIAAAASSNPVRSLRTLLGFL